MTDTTTPGTETDNNEDQNQPSDARIILGPLVKYAAMGLVLVGIIITTAVMLDRQFNNIDQEVAELEAQLAQADKNNAADTTATVELQAEVAPAVAKEAIQKKPEMSEIAEVSEAEKPAEKVAENTAIHAPAAEQAPAQPAETETVSTAATVNKAALTEDKVAENKNEYPDYFDQSLEELIAERNTYLKEMDRIYLEDFKASQEKQLQSMRDRLARQEQRIVDMEKRNQELYDIRAANMKEMQDRRESFISDRI